jgi:hypothetical protein
VLSSVGVAAQPAIIATTATLLASSAQPFLRSSDFIRVVVMVFSSNNKAMRYGDAVMQWRSDAVTARR